MKFFTQEISFFFALDFVYLPGSISQLADCGFSLHQVPDRYGLRGRRAPKTTPNFVDLKEEKTNSVVRLFFFPK